MHADFLSLYLEMMSLFHSCWITVEIDNSIVFCGIVFVIITQKILIVNEIKIGKLARFRNLVSHIHLSYNNLQK